MPKFEYKTIEIKGQSFWKTTLNTEVIDNTLNELGQQGWELA